MAMMKTLDGNEATSSVAFRTNEVIAIYPITPSSNMGEWCDEWAAQGRKNIWGTVPQVTEMQSEAGAAGAIHGALQAGALATSFTASQGLLLFMPNMYKIAGELTSFCMHVSARTIATHALAIFGDHSDVMGCRMLGFALLASGSVQEAHDFACIGQASTLAARVPFLHFFDGFRTSHEVAKISILSDDQLRAMITDEMVAAHRARCLSPDRPFIRGTAQNPDVFFQGREAQNPFYAAAPDVVLAQMDRFAEITGRRYRLFDYVGHPEADRVVVIMGSGAEVTHEYVEWAMARGERVGVLKVRLFRPFSVKHFVAALPKTVRRIAVLERTKEPGAIGEPMYLDVVAALQEARDAGTSQIKAEVFGGRYGLASKEFTPAMVKAVFDNLLESTPKNHFTVGIEDDVTHLSLPVDESFDIEPDDVVRAVFYGLGSDGTVGANKNSIKIIAEETDNFGQGYFVYDSKKAGAVTISHLRFGPRPIRSSYLIKRANFLACHQWVFLDRYDMLAKLVEGGTFLLVSPFGPDEVWDHLPREVQEDIIRKRLRFFVIDAYKVARETGMGVRINTIMQTCFFAISGVLPREEAISQIKKAIEKTYGKKGEAVVRKNFEAVDHTLAHLYEVKVPNTVTATRMRPPPVAREAPAFVQEVIAPMMVGEGDRLPVSKFPADGTWPSATSQWEKRNIALDIPVWDPVLCAQCNKCVAICPHAAIRAKVYKPELLAGAPPTFKSIDYRGSDFKGMKYTLQVAPEDCTGCGLCVAICPFKDKANPNHKAIDMTPQMPLRESEAKNYKFFLSLPDVDRTKLKPNVKGVGFMRPLFEYSGACAGCGETPYIKLLSQMFGDRALIGNATGCSSIYGGNLPTTPYAVDAAGRGPAWSNSLFEDCAEFGFGFRLAVDKQAEYAQELLRDLAPQVGDDLVTAILGADQSTELGIQAQRERVATLRARLRDIQSEQARRLELIANYLVKKSVWILGGDGWAYDIGYGGLDHVLAMGRDVNVLVLDTEVYSNTGGQASKSTPLGAAARFAMGGKATPKKDLGLMAIAYGNVYVAQVAIGAKDQQAVQAFMEADSFPGASIIIAYSHCIAHGYDLVNGPEQQKLAVDSGHWILYRYDPRRVEQGLPALQLDSPPPKVDIADYMRTETRFKMVEAMHPEHFKALMELARQEVRRRRAFYEHLAKLSYETSKAQ